MNIKKKAKLAALIIGGVVIVGGIAAGVTGYWPIAVVDRTPITYAMFEKNFTWANHFYKSNLKIAGEDERVFMTKEIQRDLQRVTMEGLIERIIIDHELAKRYKPGDLQQLIDNKIGGTDLGSADMAKATQLLYGLTPGQLKELVLIPDAKQEILEGNMTLQNESFADWMTARKNEAGVSIFIPVLYWDKNEVKVK